MTGKKITRKTKFMQVMKNKKAVEVLLSHGVYCIGCPMASTETLEEGIKSHGLDVNEIIDEINEKRKENKDM